MRSFACEDLKPLIVCRGPIRKEVMDVLDEMGVKHYGILLSEKDSIVYANALAPELRQLADNSRVHRVPDYTGASKEERDETDTRPLQSRRKFSVERYSAVVTIRDGRVIRVQDFPHLEAAFESAGIESEG